MLCKLNFDDEAGWYTGIIIEERKEDTIFFQGVREFYILNEEGDFDLIPIPEDLESCYNLI